MHPRRFKSSQSRRFVERKHARKGILAGLVIVSAVTWLFAGSRLSYAGFMTISRVEIAGADKDIASSLEAAAERALEGDYLGLFSKANTFIYPRGIVAAAVSSASSRIADVHVWRQGLSAIHVEVTEKAPAAIVCPTLPELSLKTEEDDGCYFADDTGYLFKAAPAFSGTVYNRYYAPNMSPDLSSPALAAYATSSVEFSDLQYFYNGVKAAGIVPIAILFKENGEYELYVHEPAAGSAVATTSPETGNTVVVYFNNSRPFSEELTNLAAFWHKKVDEARAKKGALTFDYIDIRYGANVFYR